MRDDLESEGGKPSAAFEASGAWVATSDFWFGWLEMAVNVAFLRLQNAVLRSPRSKCHFFSGLS